MQRHATPVMKKLSRSNQPLSPPDLETLVPNVRNPHALKPLPDLPLRSPARLILPSTVFNAPPFSALHNLIFTLPAAEAAYSAQPPTGPAIEVACRTHCEPLIGHSPIGAMYSRSASPPRSAGDSHEKKYSDSRSRVTSHVPFFGTGGKERGIQTWMVVRSRLCSIGNFDFGSG